MAGFSWLWRAGNLVPMARSKLGERLRVKVWLQDPNGSYEPIHRALAQFGLKPSENIQELEGVVPNSLAGLDTPSLTMRLCEAAEADLGEGSVKTLDWKLGEDGTTW